MLELKRTVKSTQDKTIKFIFYTEDKLIIEFSYINKDDGKDIICVPSQTMCNVGCKFCHTTDYIGKIKTRNLTKEEIFFGVDYMYQNLYLSPKTLLISYMGCGEPIFNNEGVVGSMKLINDKYNFYTRFAIATSIPENKYIEFFNFTNQVDQLKLPVKLHLSLHYTMDQIRNQWMPRSMNIMESLAAVDFFKKKTGNPVEIHYALLEGINDTEQDAILLTNLIKDRDFNVKFLFYNKKDSIDIEPSEKDKLKTFKRYFNKYSIEHEYYIPPGLDIGASCGQFLMEEYLDKNPKNEKI
jgi:23S rRNA (adenine2503-C2)-methyltransferase